MNDDRRIPTGQPDTAPRISQSEQGLQVQIADLRAQNADLERQLTKSQSNLAAPVATILPAMAIEALMSRDRFIRQVIHTFFRRGVHYGVPFPGAKAADGEDILMLYKDGADWFASAFGVRPQYQQTRCIEDRAAVPPTIAYEYRCQLVLIATGQIVGDAIGFCTSEEEGYKYRSAAYKCPNCDQETIMRSGFKEEGESEKGWYCNRKKGGCGAKYAARAAEILNQPKPGRTVNMETPAQAHNISAKAEKRAFVLAMRTTFGLNVYFKLFEDLDEDGEADEAPQVVNGTATPVEPPATPSPEPMAEFVADDKVFDGHDIQALNTFMLAKYDDLKGNIGHAAKRVQVSFDVTSWPEVIKLGVTRAQIVEKVEQHMAEKAALAE